MVFIARMAAKNYRVGLAKLTGCATVDLWCLRTSGSETEWHMFDSLKFLSLPFELSRIWWLLFI